MVLEYRYSQVKTIYSWLLNNTDLFWSDRSSINPRCSNLVVQWSTLWLGIQLYGCTYTWISHCTRRRGIIHGSTEDEKSLQVFLSVSVVLNLWKIVKPFFVSFHPLGFAVLYQGSAIHDKYVTESPQLVARIHFSYLSIIRARCICCTSFPSKEFPQCASLLRHLWLLLSLHPRWMLNGPFTLSLSLC